MVPCFPEITPVDTQGALQVMAIGRFRQKTSFEVSHHRAGALAQIIGYSLEAPAPPFPVFVLGYAVNGFGMSLQVG